MYTDKTIARLLSIGLPATKQALWETSPNIRWDLQPCICFDSDFTILDDIDNMLSHRRESSLLLIYLRNDHEIHYHSEKDIELHILLYLRDILVSLGLNEDVKLLQHMEVLRLNPDIWLLCTGSDKTPFLVLGIKIPDQDILQHAHVLAQLAQYMNILKHYHGIKHVFGVLSTLAEWRVCWLPECDQLAVASQLCMTETNATLSATTTSTTGTTDSTSTTASTPIATTTITTATTTTATVLHGTAVLQGNDPSIHRIIASVIQKALYTAKHSSTQLPPLIQRTALKVDQKSIAWAQLSKKVAEFTLDRPSVWSTSSSFYLLRDLHHGAQGRVWLAATCTRRSSIVVLKLVEATETTQKRSRLEEEEQQVLTLRDEQSMWVKMGFYAYCLTLDYNDAFCMPYGITCIKRLDGTLAWDTTVWSGITPQLAAEYISIVENTLKQVTPLEALSSAVDRSITKEVWHQDIEYRHIALLLIVTPGYIWGDYGMEVVPAFIDYGKACRITGSNREWAAVDMRTRDRAIRTLYSTDKTADIAASLVAPSTTTTDVANNTTDTTVSPTTTTTKTTTTTTATTGTKTTTTSTTKVICKLS